MFIACAITGIVFFALGVVFGRTVLSEAATIKSHITDEADKIRAAVVAEVANLRKKL